MTHVLARLAAAAACCASASTQEHSPPRLILDQVIARVESNYAGYRLEVAADEARSREYRTLCERLRQRAAALDGEGDAEGSLALLRSYVRWFDDGHLFVQEYPSFTPAELARFRAATPTQSIDGLAARLRRPGKELDPIEGLWFTPDLEIAIERTGEAGAYAAVVLETRVESWAAGEVIAEFARGDDGGYAATLRLDDHSPRRIDAELHGPFLHLPPHTWGRRLPLPPHDQQRLDATDPRAPTFRVLDDEAAVITLPSLAPNYGKKLNKLCHLHADDITARKLLIIDLRGNEGGSSTAARPLAPFYHSEPDQPPRTNARPHVLSCDDTIAYYGRMKSGFFTPAWLRSVRKRLKENPGQLIPLYEPAREHRDHVPRQTHTTPTDVAIVIDGHVVSAGEAFVLEAARHGKVRTFGSPTGGMIDYQNVAMVAIGAGQLSVVLGYPVIAAAADLPKGGFNRTGVAPDVAIDAGVTDVIGWVREQYR